MRFIMVRTPSFYIVAQSAVRMTFGQSHGLRFRLIQPPICAEGSINSVDAARSGFACVPSLYSYHKVLNLHLSDFQVRDSSLWKTNGKDCAAMRVIFGSNRPTLAGNNTFTKSQTDSVSCGARVFPAVESFKQKR